MSKKPAPRRADTQRPLAAKPKASRSGRADKAREALAAAAVHRRRAGETARLLQEIGERRAELRDQVARDRARRYAQFLRDVTHPTEPAGSATRAAKPKAGRLPLRILAEGDSWFNYPLGSSEHPFGEGVIPHLESLLGYPILNMAHAGEEAREMLGLKRRQELISKLADPNIHYDAILFSGGGNDLAGDQFIIWLKDEPPEPPPEQMLDDDAVNAMLAVLEAELLELVAIVQHSGCPDAKIFVNCYDFPFVTGIGVCGLGPWLKPSLDFAYQQMAVVPTEQKENAVVKTLMKRFKIMLDQVAKTAGPNFIVVPTQGTLTLEAEWWNEIHPTPAGFDKIAMKFQTALNNAFP
jgi:hypothetical protein